MRVYALFLAVACLSLYAYRDWFKSLCGLILLMAAIEHPDMPKSILDIQGLNPWNLLMANILAGWWLTRAREGRVWDLPRSITLALAAYGAVVVIAFARLVLDRDGLDYTPGYLVSEYLINSVKWVLPGLLLFDGCRTRRRTLAALGCVLGVFLLLALQVIRWMPPGAALSGTSLNHTALKLIANEVGYHPVNMSMMLAGASWAILATLPLVRRPRSKLLIVLAALTVSYGQALTGGRMGYVTWGAVGLVLCLLKWRKYLLLMPVILLLVTFLVPGAVERMLQGFVATDAAGQVGTDDYQVTSGRTLIWPYVIEKIAESPVIGYGRLAMKRTGITTRLWNEFRESFPHPHNAYLECLLDNGGIGLLLLLPFYLIVLFRSTQLFLDRRQPLCAAAGGVALALVLALLVAGMGSQTFYPREGAVGMWAAIGVMLRVSVARQHAGAVDRVRSVARTTGVSPPRVPYAKLRPEVR